MQDLKYRHDNPTKIISIYRPDFSWVVYVLRWCHEDYRSHLVVGRLFKGRKGICCTISLVRKPRSFADYKFCQRMGTDFAGHFINLRHRYKTFMYIRGNINVSLLVASRVSSAGCPLLYCRRPYYFCGYDVIFCRDTRGTGLGSRKCFP